MMNTLRLSRHRQRAGLTPEHASALVTSLHDEMDEDSATRADVCVPHAAIRSEIKSEIGSLRHTLLRSRLGMAIAPTGVTVAVTQLA